MLPFNPINEEFVPSDQVVNGIKRWWQRRILYFLEEAAMALTDEQIRKVTQDTHIILKEVGARKNFWMQKFWSSGAGRTWEHRQQCIWGAAGVEPLVS